MPVNRDFDALLDRIVCPICREQLSVQPARLRCTGCGAEFALHENTPELTASESTAPSLAARLHYALLGNPRVYDFQQTHGGGPQIAAEVKKALRDADDATVIDIGAGTGMAATIVPARTRYVWLDNDKLKLRGLLSKPVDCFAVLGDATRLPFPDGGADWTLMVEVSHHLPAEAFDDCLDEVARVTRNRFIFVDAVRGNRLRSKLLWQLDLGRFPRTEEDLLLALGQRFDLQAIERFRVNHDHLLCVCVPRLSDSSSVGV
jgi:SAM-dependent methyltransferase